MSNAIEIANAMAAQLNAADGLSGVIEALVDRQLDIVTEIEKRVLMAAGKAKGKGAVITIFYQGFQNPDASGATYPKVTRNYLCSLYAAQVLGTGNTPADDLLELAARALHNWDTDGDDSIDEIHVLSGLARPDDDFLIYDIEVKVMSRL